MRSRIVSSATTVLAATLMFGAFVLVGGFGELPAMVGAAPSSTPSITRIDVNRTCGISGGFNGTVRLSAPFTGTLKLELFYHTTKPTQDWFDSGVSATIAFSDSRTGSYKFGPFTGPPFTNTYRVQVASN